MMSQYLFSTLPSPLPGWRRCETHLALLVGQQWSRSVQVKNAIKYILQYCWPNNLVLLPSPASAGMPRYLKRHLRCRLLYQGDWNESICARNASNAMCTAVRCHDIPHFQTTPLPTHGCVLCTLYGQAIVFHDVPLSNSYIEGISCLSLMIRNGSVSRTLPRIPTLGLPLATAPLLPATLMCFRLLPTRLLTLRLVGMMSPRARKPRNLER